MGFPEQLKTARLRMNYTQQQVADLMGITKSTYCGYETGKRQPDVLKIKLLADILQTSGDVLLETGLGPDYLPQNKKSPSTAEAAPGEDVSNMFDKLNDLLVSEGFIKDGDDLTDRQAEILLAVCRIINAAF